MSEESDCLLAATIPLDILERVLVMAMRCDDYCVADIEAINLIEAEIAQVRQAAAVAGGR